MHEKVFFYFLLNFLACLMDLDFLLFMNCKKHNFGGEWNKFNKHKSLIRIAIVCFGINLIPLYHVFNKPSKKKKKSFTSKTAAYTPK